MADRTRQGFGQQVAGPVGPAGPAGPAGPTTLVQSKLTALAADKSTGSAVFSSLLSSTITTTTGGVLLIWVNVGASNDTNNIHDNIFAVFVDGVRQRTAGFTSSGGAHHACVGIAVRMAGVAAGLHTVEIQWRTGGGTLSCNPTTDDNDVATILVQETTV